jgi:hypothetical protein
MSYTIGENNQPPGKYRTTLFGTTDVYFQLTINRKTGELEEASTVACARPADTLYWGIDYDPSPGGDFGKTAKTQNLAIPDLDLSALPAPTEKVVDGATPTPLPLTTVWTKTITGDAHQITYPNTYIERFVTDLDLVKLRNEGYKRINLKVEIDMVGSGNQVYFHAYFPANATDTSGNVGAPSITTENNKRQRHTYEFSGDIGSFYNHLYFVYMGQVFTSGTSILDDRTYTITARK